MVLLAWRGCHAPEHCRSWVRAAAVVRSPGVLSPTGLGNLEEERVKNGGRGFGPADVARDRGNGFHPRGTQREYDDRLAVSAAVLGLNLPRRVTAGRQSEDVESPVVHRDGRLPTLLCIFE